VSTQVGIVVTAWLKRRAYAARYSFPAMTWALWRIVEDT
jgi:hypothetical protein